MGSSGSPSRCSAGSSWPGSPSWDRRPQGRWSPSGGRPGHARSAVELAGDFDDRPALIEVDRHDTCRDAPLARAPRDPAGEEALAANEHVVAHARREAIDPVIEHEDRAVRVAAEAL